MAASLSAAAAAYLTNNGRTLDTYEATIVDVSPDALVVEGLTVSVANTAARDLFRRAMEGRDVLATPAGLRPFPYNITFAPGVAGLRRRGDAGGRGRGRCHLYSKDVEQ